eukprot:2707863-Lingulodinium_polyedra.AAC.1
MSATRAACVCIARAGMVLQFLALGASGVGGPEQQRQGRGGGLPATVLPCVGQGPDRRPRGQT